MNVFAWGFFVGTIAVRLAEQQQGQASQKRRKLFRGLWPQTTPGLKIITFEPFNSGALLPITPQIIEYCTCATQILLINVGHYLVTISSMVNGVYRGLTVLSSVRITCVLSSPTQPLPSTSDILFSVSDPPQPKRYMYKREKTPASFNFTSQLLQRTFISTPHYFFLSEWKRIRSIEQSHTIL